MNQRGGVFGFFIIENHFYNAIPDFRALREDNSIFSYKYELPMQLDEQLNLLRSFKKYDGLFAKKYLAIGGIYDFKNGSFGHDDSYLYFSMINSFKPRKIIEIGSGFSTQVAVLAREYGKFELDITCIEPFPRTELNKIDSLVDLKVEKLENIDIEFFKQLECNDFLFIDSSHVIKSKNDVVRIYLEILPILRRGVIIHVHDISLPYEIHPAIFSAGYSWNEQYLLHALMLDNKRYKDLLFGYYLSKDYFEEFKMVYNHAVRGDTGGSLWLQIREETIE